MPCKPIYRKKTLTAMLTARKSQRLIVFTTLYLTSSQTGEFYRTVGIATNTRLRGERRSRDTLRGYGKLTFWMSLRLCYSVQRSSPETFPALSRFRVFQPIRGYELLLTRHGCRSNRTMRHEPLPLSNGSDSSLHR